MDNDVVLIAARNLADTGDFSWYSGWWLESLPLANTLDRRINLFARTSGTDPAGTNFTLNLPKLGVIGAIALCNHNMSAEAKWRVLLSNDGSNWFFDSGPMPVWPTVEEFGVLPWGVFQWGGTLATEIIGTYKSNLFLVFDPTIQARYVRIYLIDPTNAEGFIQFGRLFVGPYWQPSVGAQYPLDLWYEDPSRVSYSRGGQTYIDQQKPRRCCRFRVAFLGEAEIMGQVFEGLDLKRGIAGDLLVMINPSNLAQLHRQSFYGRQRTLQPVRMDFVEQWEREFEFEEFV